MWAEDSLVSPSGPSLPEEGGRQSTYLSSMFKRALNHLVSDFPELEYSVDEHSCDGGEEGVTVRSVDVIGIRAFGSS